jgi:hypothetical protein
MERWHRIGAEKTKVLFAIVYRSYNFYETAPTIKITIHDLGLFLPDHELLLVYIIFCTLALRENRIFSSIQGGLIQGESVTR